jgi:hypothetical protein
MVTFVFHQVFNLLNLRNLGSTLLWAERSRSSAAATGPPPSSSAKSGRPGGLGDLWHLPGSAATAGV